MKTTWTKGLTGQAKEEMVSSFAASAALRARAIEIMQEKIKTANKERISKDGYQDSNWAYRQADIVGYERALTELISIFES